MTEHLPSIVSGLVGIIGTLVGLVGYLVKRKEVKQLKQSITPLKVENAALRASIPPSARVPMEAYQTGDWPEVGDTARSPAMAPPAREPLSSHQADVFLAEKLREMDQRCKRRSQELQAELDSLKLSTLRRLSKFSSGPPNK